MTEVAVCQHCEAPLVGRHHRARFCSDSCRLRHQRRATTGESRKCAMCEKSFGVLLDNLNQKTCSRLCRDEYNRQRLTVQPEPEPSPDVWDGHTRYSYTPQRGTYRLVCALCSDERYLRLTVAEARALRPVGCERCGARMWLEEVPTTDPAPTRYRRTAAERWSGPTRDSSAGMWSEVA